jgi:hypothetical protein
MKSVADLLRRETARRVQALSAGERIELSLSLGDAGLQAFCSAQGLSRDEGLGRLQRQRQQGRRPSVCRRLPSS